MVFKNNVLVGLAKQLAVQVIQFQTVFVFVFAATTSDQENIMYKNQESEEFK